MRPCLTTRITLHSASCCPGPGRGRPRRRPSSALPSANRVKIWLPLTHLIADVAQASPPLLMSLRLQFGLLNPRLIERPHLARPHARHRHLRTLSRLPSRVPPSFAVNRHTRREPTTLACVSQPRSRISVDPFTTSGTWLQFAASGVALAICIVVAATAGRGWNWSFFAWGVVAGAIGICAGPLIQRWSDSVIRRRTHEQVSEEQRQRRRKWRPSTSPTRVALSPSLFSRLGSGRSGPMFYSAPGYCLSGWCFPSPPCGWC
jgi:hypothetical protein